MGGNHSHIALKYGPHHVESVLHLYCLIILKTRQVTLLVFTDLYAISSHLSVSKVSTSNCVQVSVVRETRGDISFDVGRQTDNGGKY